VPFLRQGFDPAVVVVASKNVPAPGPGQAAYSAAKAALTEVARVAALELGGQGVRVNVLHPNAVFDTAIWTDEVLAASDVVITASGTATVQTAIHERPMVIVYRLAPLTYALGRRLVHVDTYGMVNLVAGRKIAPELIQEGFTPDAVAREALRLLEPGPARTETLAALRDVRCRLGGEGASRRAAEAVLAITKA
jgi:lipid A disaccharide synthetase